MIQWLTKEKVTQREFLSPTTFSRISNGENVRKLVLNLMLKFHDDPTVNESKIVILQTGLTVSGKKREFWEEEKGKQN